MGTVSDDDRPHDPVRGDVRWDSFLHDGAGSPYGLLSILLPGFSAFRYPGKILVFTAVALAVLAGAGWDRVQEDAGDARRVRRLGLAGLGASLLALLLAWAARDKAIAYFSDVVPLDSIFGPADIEGAWAETERALVHGTIVIAAIRSRVHWAVRNLLRRAVVAGCRPVRGQPPTDKDGSPSHV